MLSQLTYVSARTANCSDAEIEKILGSCKKNNPSLDITGVLLYTPDKFIQMVEGESTTILGLYDKIKSDKRHRNAMMISYGPISQKMFPSWHMGSRKLSSSDIEFKTDITEVDKEIFENVLSGKKEETSRVLNLLRKFF